MFNYSTENCGFNVKSKYHTEPKLNQDRREWQVKWRIATHMTTAETAWK